MIAALKSLLQLIVPPPRRPLRWWQAWPPVVAIGAGLVGWWALEAGRVALFANPQAFWLLPVLAWFWWLQQAGRGGGLGRWRAGLALWSRLLLVLICIGALAEPRSVRESDDLAIVVALDVSDSIGQGAADAGLAWTASAAAGKPADDRLGLVVFGRDAAVELPPRVIFPFDNALNAQVASDGTDLAAGLELAAALLPSDRPGRVVLLSDGCATEGQVAGVVADLAARQVPIDVLPVHYDLEREVWVERLDLPSEVHAGETYEAAVLISALQDGSGTLRLRENGRVIAEEEIRYRAGKNRYALPLHLRGPGSYAYLASLAVPPADDHWEANNQAMGFIQLRGDGQVLLLVDGQATSADHRFLAEALQRGGRAVVVEDALAAPRSAIDYELYDAVVLANVPAEGLDPVQQAALHDAVYHLGVGLAMIGGGNSFGPGGWHRTPVAEALPVSMDISQKRVLPKGALAVVLHTCEFPQGNTWGKRIAKQAIKVLGQEDEAGVLVYAGGVEWLLPLTPVKDFGHIARTIEAARIGDMPSFTPTMQLGLQGLQASDAASKHVIIISDGDPSPPPPSLLQKYQRAQISISTVAVFPHGGQLPPVMKMIADATGGRFYHPNDPAQLPGIFIKEAKTLKRSMIQNVDFVPEVGYPSPILKGIDALPPLHGYVITTPRDRAEVVLRRRTPADETDPVLAVWRYGLGASAAVTTDLSDNWAVDWLGWPGYQALVEQLFTAIARQAGPEHLSLRLAADGSYGEVLVEDHHPDAGLLDLQAKILRPDGDDEILGLTQMGPGRYHGSFRLDGRGRYQVLVVARGDGRQERLAGDLSVAYAPEYRRFASDHATLQDIARRSGGRLLDGSETPAELFGVERSVRRSSRSVVDLVLVAIACLLLADVAVRRIQLDLARLAFWRRRPAAASTQTMGALLARKERLDRTRADRPQAIPGQADSGGGRAEPPASKKADAPKQKTDQTPPASNDTMRRLLERKRRLQDEREDEG